MGSNAIIWWKNANGEKFIFDNSEINQMSRNHAIDLFSGKVPVLAIENGMNIVNDAATRDKLAGQRKKVMLFSEVERSDAPFGSVGFLGKTVPLPKKGQP